MADVSIKDLKSIVALSELPDEHLQWILDHSEYSEYADGDIIAKYGEPADYMWICLSGRVTFYMSVNGRQVYYFTFENNNQSGGVGGLLPYSRMKTLPGYSYAQGEVKVLRMHKSHFTELEHLNPDFIQRLIGYMTERARAFAVTQLQHEKVNALGNLAAGIAHELNNPAAAINEISTELADRLSRNYSLTKDLIACHMMPEQLQKIKDMVASAEEARAHGKRGSTLERMKVEEDLEDWLGQAGSPEREAAETFAESGLTISELEVVRRDVGDAAFRCVVPWLENIISSQKIIQDLASASGHISRLVTSIKNHVHMDRANDLQVTDIQKGIENTLILLGFKLREKNIRIVRNFSEDLPEVPAYVGELNQVWTNLIDNAIFAMESNGTLIIETTHDGKNVTVSITDSGKGIPPENLSRIFDPFFTTKKVGEGTGIGLDIVNRIVRRHNGEIKVTSQPGNTRFSVCIPLIHETAFINETTKSAAS